MNGESHIPIRVGEMKENAPRINSFLTTAKWKPAKRLPEPTDKKTSTGGLGWSSTPLTEQTEQSVSIVKSLREIVSQDPLVLSEDATHIVHVIREGFCLGYSLAKNYLTASGLEVLMQQNTVPGRMSGAQQTEFSEKNVTMSAVALFGAASYVVWKLSNYKKDETSSIHMEFPGVPEVFLTNLHRATECSLFYFGFCIEKAGLARTDLQVVKLTELYFQNLLEEIRNRALSLSHTDFFTRVGYQLEETDFVIKGFESTMASISVSTEFRKVSFSEIVGNREAKHAARRLAQRLVCYDLKERKNPFHVLGGISDVSMGFGSAGTGKSMQIAATATLLQEYCDLIGIPFVFWPFPDNIISTFQGGSAERMIPWMKRFADPDKIIYGPIDDGENNLEDRSRQGVSSGVREVIGVFLRHTEGAYAIRRGNSTLQIFTNLPEQIDRAVLSRVQARYPIDGAINAHDFGDQNFLWQKKFEQLIPGFVNLASIPGYTFLADQADASSISAFETDEPQLSDDRMLEVHAKILKQGLKRHDHAFFAELFAEVKKVYPNFTSRDIRNIQKAVDARLMDFDLPDEWFEDLSLFFKQSYEQKFELVKDLMKESMKGLSFADVLYRESIKYLNVLGSITNVDREREIARMIQNMEIQEEALRRFKNK